MIFFTADTHFGHANIIKFCNRPYQSIVEHDAGLIRNWNSVVSPNDTVYHLGDFCFSNFNYYFSQLNGTIHFISGNHDREAYKNRAKFASYQPYLEIKSKNNHLIVLCHYAMRTWNKDHYGSWMLYGHSHGTLSDIDTELSIDVGVDCHNYRPISVLEVEHIMAGKHWVSPFKD